MFNLIPKCFPRNLSRDLSVRVKMCSMQLNLWVWENLRRIARSRVIFCHVKWWQARLKTAVHIQSVDDFLFSLPLLRRIWFFHDFFENTRCFTLVPCLSSYLTWSELLSLTFSGRKKKKSFFLFCDRNCYGQKEDSCTQMFLFCNWIIIPNQTWNTPVLEGLCKAPWKAVPKLLLQTYSVFMDDA